MKYLIFIILLFSKISFSQSIKIDSIYTNAVKELEHSNFGKAEIGFLKIISIDSNYLDTYYNLGVTYLKQNIRDKAIFYFQKSAKLMDYESAKILIDELKVKLEYADFIGLEFVDKPPIFVFEEKTYVLFDKKSLPIIEQIVKSKLKKSEIVKKSNFKGAVYIKLEVNKLGEMICEIQKGSGIQSLDNEIKKIYEENIHCIPAQYNSKDVGVGAWNMPVRFK
jgi:tetratricopeptide (TPR) repeat protein